MSSVFQMLGASLVLVLGMMVVLWLIYLIRKNAGIVDIGWAFGFIFTVWTYFSMGDGDSLRRWLIAILASIWAFRLAFHLIRRFLATPEDPRYKQIRENWGTESSNLKFLMLFLFQGFLVVVVSTPFLIICLNERDWSWLEGVGVLVWIGGLVGEFFADEQLNRFKQNQDNENKVCREGLWRYSRHPNYFFEWIIWIGFFLIALPGPGGWLGIVSPLIMFYLLTQVSGIPLTEAEALRSKEEAYKAYQKTTSSFFPWFPKKS